ncbi:serine/threonine-protein kinase [Streptomyces sp. NPDC016309]|uniref:serine/threonine-protein kinase n=1 Tax=Streptomyces sp. NPDC016309 TaxID=3364965 RepID=UPI003701C10A
MRVRPWSVRPDFRLTAHVVAGRYRLDDPLGRGGAADVYGGLDLRLRRPVAVKVFRPEGDAEAEDRFDGEARLLAQLQHPGLVTVYDCGRDDGRPFLVMQLVKGTTLRRRIARGPLTPAEACRIGSALASALGHVHAAGVVHRDIKPSNILVDETGVPYLTDFGISRLLDSTVHTATGALMGTAAYMAPEQVMGRGAGPAADVYSLGLVLIECLKGELEYGGPPLESAIARLHREPVIPPDLPPELVELLVAMTAADENDRPDAMTCCRALAALAPGGDSGPPVARPADAHVPPHDTLSYQAGHRAEHVGPADTGTPAEGPAAPGRAPRRTGRALLTAGTALAALGVALTGSTVPPGDGQNVASRPPHPAPTDRAPAAPAAPAASAPPASPASATAPPAGARGSAVRVNPVAERAEAHNPAPSPEAPAASRGRSGQEPGHGKAKGRPAHAKPKKNHHR